MTKIIFVQGLTIVLELRRCGCDRCSRYFFASQESDQSICSIACYELTYSQMYRKGKTSLPRARRIQSA